MAAVLWVAPVAALTEAQALEAVDRFMGAWNSESPEAFAATLQYPHVRPAARGGERVFADASLYAAGIDFAAVRATGWRRSAFISKRVVHLGSKKAHVAGSYKRFRGDGSEIWTNQVTYVVTENDGGRIGVQARFAAGVGGDDPTALDTAKVAALATVEAYLRSFNDRDEVSWAATLNYPHVRVASGGVTTWATADDYVEYFDFDRFAARFGWHHSAWESIEAVQLAPEAVNVALVFSRFDADDNKLATFNTLYLVTRQDGHWGIRSRSSFAP
ncbi:MAG: hypothetical protein VYE73_13775 [Acidobacteriota bacterium]|nr:hypothetical protein [Acidobacteriota bacterium]